MAGSDKNNKLGFNSPSFSNASDVSRIKGALDSSRAEQTNNRRGISNDETLDDENNNTRPSDLGEKEGLENKEGLDKKEDSGQKENKSSGGLIDKVTGNDNNKSSLNPLAELNPLNKITKKITKIKIYLIIGGICLCFFFFLLVIGVFVSIGSLGNGSDDYTDEETVIKDSYYNEYGEYPSYCDGEECVVEPEEEETENTEESTSETTEEGTSEENSSEEETDTNQSSVVKPYHPDPPKADENVPMVE